jgi:hypothetical protein
MEVVDEQIADAPEIDGLVPENSMFLDIETTGLSAHGAAIYLIGAVYKSHGIWRYRQWFADRQREELDILQAFLEFAGDYQTLIHFNGTTFDVPFLRACAKQYHIELDLDQREQMDLYRLLKPMGAFLGMHQMKQKSLEERIGLYREDRYTGKELIEQYKAYEKAPSDEVKQILLLHNRDDLIGMLSVTRALAYEKVLRQTLTLLQLVQEEGQVTFLVKAQGNMRIPAPAEFLNGDFYIHMDDEQIKITVPVKDASVRFFFPDYGNYVYLPKEDQAIHKSIGMYVDPNFREKASYETAYQWSSLDLIAGDGKQLNSYMHRLFEHYIFDKKAIRRKK